MHCRPSVPALWVGQSWLLTLRSAHSGYGVHMGSWPVISSVPGVPTIHDSDLHSAALAVPLVWLLRPACSPAWALL